MKSKAFVSHISLALLLVTATLLSGCGGAISLPDSVVSPMVAGPAIQGSLFGGHAPIVGAHVYLAQPGTSGIGSASVSLLGNFNNVTSAGGYPLTANVSDPYVPVGAEYVTTDSNGAFSFTGAYACSQGQPVYAYSYGGAPGTTAPNVPANYAISTIVVSNVQGPPTKTATYTITLTSSEGFYVGETVTVSGLTGKFTSINAAQVITAVPTSSSFSFTGSDQPGSNNIAAGTYTSTNFGTAGNVSGISPANTAIVTLATLGNCPSSGNFSTAGNGAISYIYMNEVSTVASAYTFQPFTKASNNNAWDIGSSGTTQGLIGIENAAATAAQLYDIQGTQTSTTSYGEGHIANFRTIANGVPNAGNGVVPQATIDTLGNILASCVDSASSTSASCTTLFDNATSDGFLAGTSNKPTDTATAAINIARYPAGNHSAATGVNANYVSNIIGLQGATVPFTPKLFLTPNDFTIVINYPYNQVGSYATNNPLLYEAENLAVDGNGLVWVTARGATSNASLTRFTALGETANTFPAAYIYGDVSVDGANDAWVSSQNTGTGVFEAYDDGTSATHGSGFINGITVITDNAGNNGNAYFVAATTTTAGNYELFEYDHTGTLLTPFVISPDVITAANNVHHGAIDASGDLWLTSQTSYQIARVNNLGVSAFTPVVTPRQPETPSIDGSGNAWVAIQGSPSEVYKVSSTGVSTVLTGGTTGTNHTGATFASTDGSAIDGNGNVWLANRCGNYVFPGGNSCGTAAGYSSIVELNGSNNLAISPASNYIPEAQYPATTSGFKRILNDPLNLAIDPSGDVWITNFTGNSLAEMIGAAAPAVTPLSVAAGTGMLGQTP